MKRGIEDLMKMECRTHLLIGRDAIYIGTNIILTHIFWHASSLNSWFLRWYKGFWSTTFQEVSAWLYDFGSFRCFICLVTFFFVIVLYVISAATAVAYVRWLIFRGWGLEVKAEGEVCEYPLRLGSLTYECLWHSFCGNFVFCENLAYFWPANSVYTIVIHYTIKSNFYECLF